MLELNKLYNMDCIEGLKQIADEMAQISLFYDGVTDNKKIRRR